MAHDALTELFTTTAWRADDVLVIDLPPGTGDIVLTTLQEIRVDGVLVATTPFHASLSDTARTVELFRDNGVPVLGTVCNMAEYVCDCCGEPNDLFRTGSGQPKAELGTSVIAEVPFTREMQATPDPDDLPAPVAALTDAVTAELETVGELSVPEDAVDIRGLPPQARKTGVETRFETLESGEEFVLVSDRDPKPVREFLATVVDRPVDALDPFDVRRVTPDDWSLETIEP